MRLTDIPLPGAEPITDDPLLLVGGISRSGTTLLTTVLDAHPAISMGAELIPTPMYSLNQLRADFEKALELANGDFAATGKIWKENSDRNVGLFFTRCHRAGVTLSEFKEVLNEYSEKIDGDISSWRDRLTLAWTLMRRRQQREGTQLFGFKLNSTSLVPTAMLMPNAYYVCIVRDPVDVIASQIKRKFQGELAEQAKRWTIYTKRYCSYANKHPDRCIVIRYEDLVRSPRRTLEKVFEMLPIEINDAVYSYHKSDAAIFNSTHPNLDRIKMSFSDSSVGSGYRSLTSDQIDEIHQVTGASAKKLGYSKQSHVIRPSTRGFGLFGSWKGPAAFDTINPVTARYHRARVTRAAKFKPAEYESLLAPYVDDYKAMRLIDYARMEDQGDDKVLLIRHDVDHDLDTAVKIAKWEHERGLRTTYCLLHTAWYYGPMDKKGHYQHSRMLMDGIERLLELGHEINFHNNLVALALRERIDPYEMLERELEFFDSCGVPIVGSSTHGDALCRELEFRNWELFSECCDDRFGGPRDVSHTSEDGHTTTFSLGRRSMFEFGLEYEAYDIARDIYHTDSGGIMRTREDTRGRRDFGRKDGRGHVVGVLTHPIWWSF